MRSGESLEFVGEDLVDHTPRNEKVKLKIGDAFDVLAEEVQTENTQISSKVWEQEFEITFKNRKKENIEIEVERNLGKSPRNLSEQEKSQGLHLQGAPRASNLCGQAFSTECILSK